MKTPCIWSSKSVSFSIPQLDFDFGSSYVPRQRRRKRRVVIVGTFSKNSLCVFAVRNFHLSIHSTDSKNRDLHFSCDFFTKNSKQDRFVINFGSNVNSEPENSFRIPFALALEQDGIGNHSPKKERELTDGFFERSKNEECGTGFVQKPDKKYGNESELGGEKVSLSVDGDRTVDGNGSSSRVDVRALGWGLRVAKTAEDVEDVLKEMELLPLNVYSSLIRGLGRDQRLNSAMALVEWLKSKKDSDGSVHPNLYTYNSLLGAVKQCGQFGEVDKVLGDMEAQGITPNVVTYNTLMAIYLEQGDPRKALDIFKDIQKMDLSLSAVTYSTALLAYRRMEDANGALGFFIETKEKCDKGEIGSDSDEDWENEMVKLENFTVRICCQVMRKWLVKGDHLTTNVLKLLTDFDRAGLQLSRAEYEKLVWACTQEGHFVVAKELYHRIREREMDISLSVCNHVIWLMGKAKKWWAALEIYEDLLDKGPEPNNLSYELIVSHFNVLLTAARRRGIWRWGVRLLNKMEDKGLKPGSREWNAVLVACSKASETSAAVQIFRRMVEKGEKPTILSYGALLSALEKGKLYDEALRVWEHMGKVGVKPNVHAYTIMVSVYIGQGNLEEVDAILRDMVSSGIEPTVVTYNAIISGFARSGMGGAAFEWFHRMKVGNIMPNEITYEMLIAALGRDGKPKLAYDMYLRALNEGFHLSSRAYDFVVQSCWEYNASIDVSLLGPRPTEKKMTIKTRKVLTEFCDLADVPRRGKPFASEEIFRS